MLAEDERRVRQILSDAPGFHGGRGSGTDFGHDGACPGIREAPLPIERTAYIKGRVTKILPNEGVIVTCEGALVQGIFGVGGERLGIIEVVTHGPEQALTDDLLNETHRGKIVVGGANVTGAALRKAADVGAVGVVCGGVIDRELMDYLAEALNQPGYDIGVAITGQEAIAFTLVVTEGFGIISMAARAFGLFRSLQGKTASINGATQIRAGVIRPEVIVPLDDAALSSLSAERGSEESGQLAVGTPIRVIREPYFGRLGNRHGSALRPRAGGIRNPCARPCRLPGKRRGRHRPPRQRGNH